MHYTNARCRCNCFPPLDSFESCNQTLGDLTYIDAPMPKRTGALMKALLFQGPGWYTLPAVQWLLHTGKISWGKCTHASARHPCDYLRKPLDIMVRAWSRIDDGKRYAKNSISSLIGTLYIRDDVAWLLRSSRTEDDLKPLSSGQACLKIHTEYEGRSIYDYVLETKLVDTSSFRPIHDLTLHTEATRMAQALAIIEKLGPPAKAIFESKTDSILRDDCIARSTYGG